MKKFLALGFFLAFAGICKADDNNVYIQSIIYPVFKAGVSSGVNPVSSSTIVAAGGGLKNCITDFTLFSTLASNFTIQDGSLQSGTTIWGMVTVPANTPVTVTTGDQKNALCGGGNSPMVVSVSTGSASISYRGYIRSRP